jgi:alkylation response protein AidB-like acyl-CoA dehydrogenase
MTRNEHISDPFDPIDRPTVHKTMIDSAIDAAAWVEEHVPWAWREAAAEARPIREVRTFAEYESWYPTFAHAGLVVPTWPKEYGGLDVDAATARAIEQVLAPYHLGRLNPLGLNLCAPALLAYGTETQRLRYLPRIVDNSEKWCQLFSEPGAGSDLASLATRASRDGDDWILTGQKVWTTWAHVSDWAVCLARTDPDVPKRNGITYFLVDLRADGVEVRPLRHLTGEVDFNEVFLDGVRVPDDRRVGATGHGWKVANATLSGERQMVSGAGSGGVDRIGGLAADALEVPDDPISRHRVVALQAEERIRSWTNRRLRGGPLTSIGKVHQGDLNQRIQLAAVDLLGADAIAWEGDGLDRTVKGMLRSRANTIEGGTTEVNKNVVGERVLGLPREPDPHNGAPWKDVPRS